MAVTIRTRRDKAAAVAIPSCKRCMLVCRCDVASDGTWLVRGPWVFVCCVVPRRLMCISCVMLLTFTAARLAVVVAVVVRSVVWAAWVEWVEWEAWVSTVELREAYPGRDARSVPFVVKVWPVFLCRSLSIFVMSAFPDL